MERAPAHTLPARDPFAGGPLVITELEAVESGVTIRGRFEVPRFARLSPDQAHYLETFLRCRGMLNSVERELGISYPTARARLDAVLRALDLHAVREEPAPPAPIPAIAPDEPVEGPPAGEEAQPETGAWTEANEATAPEMDPVPDEPAKASGEEPRYTREEILSMLERGEMTVEDVKRELGKVK